MEEAEDKFKKFDWASSEEWQLYWNNLYPTPPLSKVDKFKRSWFKRNVDSNISPRPLTDLNDSSQHYSSQHSSQQYSSQHSSSQPYTSQYSSQQRHGYMVHPGIVVIEIYIRLIYLIVTTPLLFIPLLGTEFAAKIYSRLYYTSMALLFVFLALGVVRERGVPKLNSAWLASAFFSDMTQYIMYVSVILISPQTSIFIILPFLTCLIGLNNLAGTRLPKMHELPFMMLNKILEYTKDKNYWLLQTRGDVECYLFFYIIFKAFTRGMPLVTMMTYMNFVKMRLNASDAFISLAFSNIHGGIIKLLSNDLFGPMPLNMYLKLTNLLNRYVFSHRR